MTEQQQHLANLLKQRQTLNQEYDFLQSQLNTKKELYWKVQGAIDYLQQIGVTIPENQIPSIENAISEETQVE